MSKNENMNEPCGVLIIDKPEGFTSHDVVGKIRRLYGTRRVGHTGTLDPMATGVLVILIGRSAKASEYLVCDEKEYIATLRLGITTDTEDTTGEILTKSDTVPSPDEVFAACEKFKGKLKQVPPMYSALKVNGQKLYDLARKGIEVERQARDIEIFELDCNKTESKTDYTLRVKCSSGTYIRTLCADIGQALGCGGAMATLRRVSAGGFKLENAYTLDYIESLGENERKKLLIPTEELFSTLKSVSLPTFYEKLCRSGCEIYQSKIKTDFEIGEKVRICSQNGEFFALGEVRMYDGGSAVKSIKIFSLE